MHEAAVCREIMDVVGKAAEDGGLTKVCEIVIAAGPYSCIQENQLNFYFNIAKTGTCMEEGVIRIVRDESLKGPSQIYVRSISGD